jgi:hypothetical protein
MNKFTTTIKNRNESVLIQAEAVIGESAVITWVERRVDGILTGCGPSIDMLSNPLALMAVARLDALKVGHSPWALSKWMKSS